MKTVTSVSGGQSSAYIAANYPADFLVFALVCIEDEDCKPKDEKLVQMVSDKIGRDFIATAEDDTILHTMFDLEQFLGQEIEWVVGRPFDKLRNTSLPNVTWRHCTELLKIRPMFRWWKNHCNIQEGEAIKMQIGFRAGEEARAKRMLDKCDDNGLRSYAKTPWQKPSFPMIEDNIRRDAVVNFWRGKPVRFAPQNNCVGCFQRNPLTLRKMFDLHPNKMAWFVKMEEMKGAQWKKEMSYSDIAKHRPQVEIDFEEWGCDTGYCGV